jgi:hypothetical protein
MRLRRQILRFVLTEVLYDDRSDSSCTRISTESGRLEGIWPPRATQCLTSVKQNFGTPLGSRPSLNALSETHLPR